MKLKESYLCIDCEELFVAAREGCNPSCPSCTSRSFVPVAGIIPTMAMLDRRTSSQGVTRAERAALADGT